MSSRRSQDKSERLDCPSFIYQTKPDDFYKVGRTLRSLRAAGYSPTVLDLEGSVDLKKVLSAGRPVLLARAGAWMTDIKNCTPPLSGSLGNGLCALGAVRAHPMNDLLAVELASKWKDLLLQTGGDLGRLREDVPALAPFLRTPPVLYLDLKAVARLAEARVFTLSEIGEFAARNFRVVRYPPLDVYCGEVIRVLQVITALHRGGAERVTLDLFTELRKQGWAVQLATLGRALRKAFPSPPGALDLANGDSIDEICSSLHAEAIQYGTDIIHGHLISKFETQYLSRAGFPVVLTLHNTQIGWPSGINELQKGDAALLVGCAYAIEQEALAAQLAIPTRTIRNGIDLDHFRVSTKDSRSRQVWRKGLGLGEQDLLLVAVANPRPQKRLHLLPPILGELKEIFGTRQRVRLIFCGEAIAGKIESEDCVRATRSEVSRLGLEEDVRWLGAVSEIHEILNACDVLVSTSAHEGLSLAQLEALAMGCRVVAADVGGACEIAWNNPNIQLVPVDASPSDYARSIAEAVSAKTSSVSDRALGEHWSSRTMANHYARLYSRAIAVSSRKKAPEGLWLITNNFSTGGAQSSARRLLFGLSEKGEKVRAAVVEEDPEYPTPGRRLLVDHCIPVMALSPDQTLEAAVKKLLAAIDVDLPEAVVFWNLRPEFKVHLSDALLDVPVFDVSPGEMYYASLERFFSGDPAVRPLRMVKEYGARLSGLIVKYAAERKKAANVLGRTAEVVPNGVVVLEEVVRSRNDRTQVVFGTAARIHPQKCLEDLLMAFRVVYERLPNAALEIAGGIEVGCEKYAEELRLMVRDYPVTWRGEIANIQEFHGLLDIFVMISDPAGCPNASLEAMASGLPLIATDVGGASEQVIDGITGRFVASRDPQALAEAMVDLACQPGRWKELGRAGRDRVQTHFGMERMISEYRRILLRR